MSKLKALYRNPIFIAVLVIANVIMIARDYIAIRKMNKND